MKKFKKYLKDYRKVENCFYSGLKERTLEEKFEYINNHFRYYVRNSLNGRTTYANNVKIYNLRLTDEQMDKLYEFIDYSDFYREIEYTISEFEEKFNKEVYFNGRSGRIFMYV